MKGKWYLRYTLIKVYLQRGSDKPNEGERGIEKPRQNVSINTRSIRKL